jgi:hypothetical protein
VYRRAWILEEWFDSLEAQNVPDGTRLIFGVNYNQDGQDDGTVSIIQRRWPSAEIIDLPGYGYEDDERDAGGRFGDLALHRNRLLRIVASLGPKHYLSWDSDIILEPGAVAALHAANKDAVGALVDMGGVQRPGNWSWMMLEGNDAERHMNPGIHVKIGRPWQVGVIMGCKLMSPHAYKNARYADHILGEDVGWAIQCEAMGVERWVAPAARGEHRWRL